MRRLSEYFRELELTCMIYVTGMSFVRICVEKQLFMLLTPCS